MKKSFITGLALLLPAVVTIILFLFALNFLTRPFIGIVEGFFADSGLLDAQFFVLNKQLVLFLARLLILVVLVAFTALIGLLGRLYIFHSILRAGNLIVGKIPLFNKIYHATQEVIKTIFENDTATFSQVVLVPFPNSSNRCIGLITNDPQTDMPSVDSHGNISVFVPATPNPTMGFMLLYKREQMLFLDMKVDEAIRFVVSCGVMSPNFKVDKP